MTTEQRRALADTIPTTEVIRDAVTFPRDRLGEPLDISPERFDAWLARVRRDAARDAVEDADYWQARAYEAEGKLWKAEARIKAVRELHSESRIIPGTPVFGCAECGEPNETEPCATIRALEG